MAGTRLRSLAVSAVADTSEILGRGGGGGVKLCCQHDNLYTWKSQFLKFFSFQYMQNTAKFLAYECFHGPKGLTLAIDSMTCDGSLIDILP